MVMNNFDGFIKSLSFPPPTRTFEGRLRRESKVLKVVEDNHGSVIPAKAGIQALSAYSSVGSSTISTNRAKH